MKRTLSSDLQKFAKFQKSSTFYRKRENRMKETYIAKPIVEKATTSTPVKKIHIFTKYFKI